MPRFFNEDHEPHNTENFLHGSPKTKRLQNKLTESFRHFAYSARFASSLASAVRKRSSEMRFG